MSDERMTEAELVALVRCYPIERIDDDDWFCDACGTWIRRNAGRHAPDCARLRFERLYPVKETT